ncbi:hypothetical protein BKA61DRAFT_710564 [Leptodontidium sp. MPI-SDFR-AT-0119]|nr:hypothetical protein BKA61DRAFT_710564 [Leptodontidium sp. MPI-SDFR-AT-0119]
MQADASSSASASASPSPESSEIGAAASIFPNKGRSRYTDVHVLLLRWIEDLMGVQYELDDLAKTFEFIYGFKTETWLIPTVKSYFALTEKALQTVRDFGDADKLLIVYYAGHGLINESRKGVWTCKSNPLFEQADADVLLLLDCCAAASGAPTDSECTSVTETIAACGFETWAPLPGRHSFTNTLIAVLDEWKWRTTFIAAMLYCEILQRLRHEKPERYRNTDKFEYRKSLIHVLSTNDPNARSIELCRRTIRREHQNNGKALNMSLRGATMSRFESAAPATDCVIAPALSSETQDLIEEPSNLYNLDSLTRVLDNGDTALPHVLITFPCKIPEDPACAFIGYVHSDNLLVAAAPNASDTTSADSAIKTTAVRTIEPMNMAPHSLSGQVAIQQQPRVGSSPRATQGTARSNQGQQHRLYTYKDNPVPFPSSSSTQRQPNSNQAPLTLQNFGNTGMATQDSFQSSAMRSAGRQPSTTAPLPQTSYFAVPNIPTSQYPAATPARSMISEDAKRLRAHQNSTRIPQQQPGFQYQQHGSQPEQNVPSFSHPSLIPQSQSRYPVS